MCKRVAEFHLVKGKENALPNDSKSAYKPSKKKPSIKYSDFISMLSTPAAERFVNCSKVLFKEDPQLKKLTLEIPTCISTKCVDAIEGTLIYSFSVNRVSYGMGYLKIANNMLMFSNINHILSFKISIDTVISLKPNCVLGLTIECKIDRKGVLGTIVKIGFKRKEDADEMCSKIISIVISK